MMQHLKRRAAGIAAFVLALFIVNSAVSPAGAVPVAPTGTSDPQLQLYRVEVTQDIFTPISATRAIAEAPTQSAARSLTLVVTAATTCWTHNAYHKGKNVFGGTLYTFHTKTNWCGDGSWIRSSAYTTADGSSVIGWKYYGLVQNYDKYGINWNQFESVREGQFCTLNCVLQNKHELIDVLVGPAGQVFRT